MLILVLLKKVRDYEKGILKYYKLWHFIKQVTIQPLKDLFWKSIL